MFYRDNREVRGYGQGAASPYATIRSVRFDASLLLLLA